MMPRFLFSFLLITILSISAEPSFAAKWTEVNSPNFVVVTNAGSGQGREVAQRFEEMRRVFGKILLRDEVQMTATLQILAFEDNADLKQVLPLWEGKPTSAAGIYVDGGTQHFIGLDLSSPAGWQPVFHEYAHALLRMNYPPTQLWFDEGFAEYLSTIKIGKKQTEIGLPPDFAPGLLSDTKSWIPVEKLFAVDDRSKDYNEQGETRGRFYAQSWLVVHYLMDKQMLSQVGRYFDLVMNKQVPIADAIQQTFGVSSQQFDQQLRDYLREEQSFSYSFPTPGGIEAVTYQAHGLKSYEAETLIADMHAHMEGYQQQAEKEMRAIVAQHPEIAEAHRVLGYLALQRDDLREASEQFRAAAEIGTSDPQVYVMMARMLRKQVEETKSNDPALLIAINDYAARALRINSKLAEAWLLRAYALEQIQSDRAAVEALQSAVKLSPREEHYQLELAREYANAQRFDDSLALYGHLKESKDPEIAKTAAEQMELVKQWKEKPILQLAKDRRQYTAPQWQLPGGQKEDTDLNSLEKAQSGQATDHTPDGRPTKYLKGTLRSVDCSKYPVAVVEVRVGKRLYRLRTSDAAALIVIGADKFSCEWKGMTVSANYKQSGPSRGDLVSLELH